MEDQANSVLGRVCGVFGGPWWSLADLLLLPHLSSCLSNKPYSLLLPAPRCLEEPVPGGANLIPFHGRIWPRGRSYCCQMSDAQPLLSPGFTRGFSQSFILRLSSTYFILPHTPSMCPQTQGHTSSVLLASSWPSH